MTVLCEFRIFQCGTTRGYYQVEDFLLAIFVQMAVVPLFFTLIYLFATDNTFIDRIQFPPLFLLASALGGFLFGIIMHYTGGCAWEVYYGKLVDCLILTRQHS